MGQSALELLGHAVLVEHGSMGGSEFGALKAHEIIRRLLTQAQIPVRFPRGARSMLYWAFKEGWPDTPRALAWVRNKLTHPKAGGPVYRRPAKLRVEAYWLILAYLELLILWICGYQGPYVERLKMLEKTIPAGEVASPPWTKRR